MRSFTSVLFSVWIGPATLLGSHFTLCAAQLVWSPKEFSETVPIDADDVKAVFSFKNTGTTPVTIYSISTSCSCTTPTLSKKTYAPAEYGKITATFNPAGKYGDIINTIEVRASDQEQPHLLTLRIRIPEEVTATPKLVYWTLGGKCDPKEIRVRLINGAALEMSELRSPSNDFRVEMQKVSDTDYVITLLPVNMGEPRQARVELRTRRTKGDNAAPTIYLYAQTFR